MKLVLKISFISATFFILIFFTYAASRTWMQLTSGGLWSVVGNWSGGMVADGSNNTADFNTLDITTDNTVHLDSARTIGNIIFGDTATSTPAGWTLDNNSTPANILTFSSANPITLNALGLGKSATISSNIKLAGGWGQDDHITVVAGGYLTLSGNIDMNGGSNVLQKDGAGVLDITGQYAGDWSGAAVVVNGGTLKFSNNLVYPDYLDAGRSGLIGNNNVNIVLRNSTIDCQWGNVEMQSAGNATSAFELHGGSMTIGTAYGGPYFQTFGIGRGNFGQNQTIVTMNDNAVLNLVNGATIKMEDNQGFQGAGHFILRSGAINGSDNSNITIGVLKGTSIFDHLGGTVSIPQDNGTSGALIVQYRMNSADSRACLLNLNGGTLTTGNILSGDSTSNFVANNSYVNFHGGTLRPAVNESNFIKTTITGVSAPLAAPHIVVWSEGAVIDTNGKNIGIQVPLVAPGGSGVYVDDQRTLTVALTEANKGSGYQAAPLVLIGSLDPSGGNSGNVASAVANMEDDGTANGTFRVSSITITNPGTNFLVAPSVNISGGTPTFPANPPTLTTATNLSGGLTKSGLGTLTLADVNTYTGSTTVGNGTLSLSNTNNNNIAFSSNINISSGAYLDVTALSSSTLNLASDQTLSGVGTVTGKLLVGSGSYISPGNSLGTINNVGDVTYAPGGSYTWQINKVTSTSGTDPGWDLQNITGALNITATSGNKFNININSLTIGNAAGNATNFNKYSNYIWTIASTSAGISNFATSSFNVITTNFTNDFTGTISNGFFDIWVSDNLLQLVYTGAVDLTYTFSYIAGPNGTLTGSTTQVVNPSTDGTAVTAIPDSGYHFVDWSDAFITNPRIDTNATSSISVTANFAITPVISQSGGSSITRQYQNLIDMGQTQVAENLKNKYPYLFVTTTVATVSTTTKPSYVFTRNLKKGGVGEDVRQLQIFLNTHGFIIAETGPGSTGNETTYFGTLTQLAIIKFQEANIEAILKPVDLTKGTGLFYNFTRNFVNKMLK